MKINKFIIITVLFIAITSGEGILEAKPRTARIKQSKKALIQNRKKGDKSMTTKIKQPFASPLLNSHFQEPLQAKGILDKKIHTDTDPFTTSPKSLLLFDERHLIIDYQSIVLLVDIQRGIIKSKRNKSSNIFISATPSTIYSGNNQLEPFTITDFETSEENYFIPGIGSYSSLLLLIPFEDFFIAGSQNWGNPKYPDPSFMLVSRMYPGSRSHWKLEFEGTITQPPVSPDGNIYIMEENTVLIIDKDGKKLNEHKGSFSPISGSIGKDGVVYLLLSDNKGLFLRTLDKGGKILWEYRTALSNIVQPPATSSNQNVYLAGKMRLECINKGQKLWEYNFPGFSGNPLFASISSNDLVVLSKGNRIVCLDSDGNEEWDYTDEEGEILLTQPIFDTSGRVITASNKNIVIIK